MGPDDSNGRPTLKVISIDHDLRRPDPDETDTKPGHGQRVTISEILRALDQLKDETGRMATAVADLAGLRKAVAWLAVSIGALAVVVGFLVWLWKPTL